MPDINQQPVKDNFGLLNAAADDHPKTLLSREAYLLGGGIKDGFMDRLQQAKENPGLTALEFGGAVAIGAGLTAMSMAKGRWETAANIATKGLQVLAIADGVRRVAPTLYAIGDTAVNPENYMQNRATVGKYLGSAFFDYPLMAAGGMAGSAGTFYGAKALDTLSTRFNGSNGAATDALISAGKPITPETRAAMQNYLDSVGKPPRPGDSISIAERLHGNENLKPGNSLNPTTDALLQSGKPITPELRAAAQRYIESGQLSNKPGSISIAERIANNQGAFDAAKNPGIKPGELTGKVIFWDKGAFDGVKNPGSGPFNPRNFDFNIKPYDFSKTPLLIESTMTRSTVFPIIPLPLQDKEIVLRKIEK
jgi:hypothetical protein